MTVQEYEARKDEPCHHCGARVTTKRNINNGADQVVCTNITCARPHRPWDQPADVKRSPRKNRKDYPMGQSPVEVWAKFKNRCAVCTLPQHALVAIGIGISAHHVTERYDPAEYDCPLIPVCNACKPLVDARQRESWRWHRRVEELKREPVPPSSAGVSQPGLSPDPVRATRQTPAGAMETVPDDDADD